MTEKIWKAGDRKSKKHKARMVELVSEEERRVRREKESV